MVTRGEVWWYEPPEAKARPHLILTRSEVIPLLSDLLAMPATRTVRGIPPRFLSIRLTECPSSVFLPPTTSPSSNQAV